MVWWGDDGPFSLPFEEYRRAAPPPSAPPDDGVVLVGLSFKRKTE